MGALVSFFRRGLRQLTAERALAFERGRGAAQRGEAADPTAEAIARLDSPGAIAFGTDRSGRVVRLRPEVGLRSGLAIGATGYGKTRWLLSVLLPLVDGMASGTGLDLDLEVSDTKGETIALLEGWMGYWLRTWPEPKRQWLRDHVRVLAWARDAVTPMPLFDNAAGLVSDAFVANFRTEITTAAGLDDYTDAVRQARFMLSWLLAALRFPLNYRFAVRLFTDDPFRRRIAERVADPHLRAYLQGLEHTLPRATAQALLRRVERELAFPEVRASVGVPPAALDRLLPRREARVTLGRFSADQVLPYGVARELCIHRHFDVIRSIPTRDRSRPLLFVDEEFAATLAAAPRLAGPITQALRTARSFGVGMLAVAQDLENAVQAETVRAYLLNSRYVVAFQSRDEAAWLAPHLPGEAATSRSEAERRRRFQREIEALPPRDFFLWVKGEPVLRLTAQVVPDPEAVAGVDAAELQALFQREVGARSMVATAVAEAEIARWEAEVLGRGEVAPPPAPAPSAPPLRSMADLLRAIGQGEEGGRG